MCKVLNSWWWTEELSETCRVLFLETFEKLVHLVGFGIRIHHDARSYECQISLLNLLRDNWFSTESLECTDCLWAVWRFHFLIYIRKQTQNVEGMRHMCDNPHTSHVRKLAAAHSFTYERFWDRSDPSTLFSFFVISLRKHWMFLYISSCQYG